MLNQLLNQIFEGLMLMESPLGVLSTSATLDKHDTVIQRDNRPDSSWPSALASTIGTSILSFACLAAYNIRWKHLLSFLLQDKPRKLPYRKVEAHDVAKDTVVVLLHGMWNDASYFEEWQDYLAEGGYTSYALQLQPGERWLPGGLLRQELVRDLENTLQDIAQPYIFMGHSRGGIVVQGALQCSPTIRRNAAGVILLGSYPLGHLPSVDFIYNNGIFSNWWGAMNILLLGKLCHKEYMKQIFLLPTVNERAPKIARYLRESVKAPSDGCLYCCWHPAPPPMPDMPALIMGAEHDVLVPPLQVKDAFRKRFPNSHHVIIPHQAHAFKDGGWQLSMVEPLMDWLDCRNEAVVPTKKEDSVANNVNGDWSQRVLEERKSFDER